MPSFFSDVDRLSLLTLNCLNLKPAKLGSWLTHYKHPSQILDNLCENTVSSKQIQTARKIAERELVEVEKNSFTILYYGETSYPKLLTEIPDPPPVLYLWGSIPTQSAITLVGTRRPSPYGLTTAEDFSASLTKNGICIVSGLATGIDQSVLQSAVDANGSALAVLGSGLLNIYPKGNISLAKKIVETGGGVISEFGLHIGPMKQNFPRRNRIMAAIASGVCVIEAPERSGALITARLACDYNRLVWAVPNMITSRSFKGNLTLLRQGAALASCFEDILEDILPILPENHPEKFLQKKKNRGIFADAMLENIDDNGSSIDELLTKVTKSREDLKKDLLKLELQGLVVKMPGGIYRVKSV